MPAKSPTYLTRVAELKATKAFAQRHPGMAKAIQPYVKAEAAALNLSGKSLEELVRLGIEGTDVEWGAQEWWGNDTADGDIWLSCGKYVELRLGIACDDADGYWLTYCVEDQWRDTRKVKTAKGLITAVARWSRG